MWHPRMKTHSFLPCSLLWNVVILSLAFWLPRKELKEVDFCSISFWYKAELQEAAHWQVLFSWLPQYHPGSAILATEGCQTLAIANFCGVKRWSVLFTLLDLHLEHFASIGRTECGFWDESFFSCNLYRPFALFYDGRTLVFNKMLI